jgi:hypothetical protein
MRGSGLPRAPGAKEATGPVNSHVPSHVGAPTCLIYFFFLPSAWFRSS